MILCRKLCIMLYCYGWGVLKKMGPPLTSYILCVRFYIYIYVWVTVKINIMTWRILAGQSSRHKRFCQLRIVENMLLWLEMIEDPIGPWEPGRWQCRQTLRYRCQSRKRQVGIVWALSVCHPRLHCNEGGKTQHKTHHKDSESYLSLEAMILTGCRITCKVCKQETLKDTEAYSIEAAPMFGNFKLLCSLNKQQLST